MNHHLSPTKTGLAVGKLAGSLHVIWSALVAFGWAQTLVDFSMWAHMVNVRVVVEPFDLSAAVAVIVVASLVGYLVGYLFARIWNWLYRS